MNHGIICSCADCGAEAYAHRSDSATCPTVDLNVPCECESLGVCPTCGRSDGVRRCEGNLRDPDTFHCVNHGRVAVWVGRRCRVCGDDLTDVDATGHMWDEHGETA